MDNHGIGIVRFKILIPFVLIGDSFSLFKRVPRDLILKMSSRSEIPNMMPCLVRWWVESDLSLEGDLRWVR